MEKFFHISVHHNKNIAGRGGADIIMNIFESVNFY